MTGGAGFMGSHLCDRLLADGHRVVAVDDLPSGRSNNLSAARKHRGRFSLDRADIRSAELRKVFLAHRPEVVFHLAAQPGVRTSMMDPMHDAGVNVLGLINVMEAARAAGTRKVVVAASGGTLYGDPRSLPAKESARRGSLPRSPYGISKKVGLDYLEFYRREHGLAYAALALANVYGPRQDPRGESGVIAIFIDRMLANKAPVIYDDGQQTRDYVYVDDVVDAFVAAEGREGSQVLNIGTRIETSVNELFRLLSRVLRYTGEPLRVPGPSGEARRSALDQAKAAKVLGWRPIHKITAGLTKTVAASRSKAPPGAGR